TGVLREYRRRGIAMALKLRAILYAKSAGYSRIKTWNEQGNRPMLSINEALGFIKQPAWIAFAKKLSDAAEERSGRCAFRRRGGALRHPWGRQHGSRRRMNIRSFTPEDYPAISAVWSTVYPEYPETADEIRHSDETRAEPLKWGRFVAESDGRIVGVG